MPELSERKKNILSSIIDLYIKSGEPVGSKGLITETGMTVSSATVRNEMSELASMGYLEQPHTSAGRIPSQSGYRFYVDHLMKDAEIDELSKRMIDAGISSANGDPEKLIAKAREILSDLTGYACVSTAPVGLNFIKKIELLPVGTFTAMMILFTSNGILKSRLCRLDEPISTTVFERFYNIVQQFFIGKPTGEISVASMQTVAATMMDDYFTLLPLLASIVELAGSTSDSKLVISGSSNLLSVKDYGSDIIPLLDFLSKKEPLNDFLSSSDDKIKISIGTENKYRQLSSSSIIVAKYKVRNDDSGTLSVIGPTRMDYEKIIPSVRYLTDLVGQMITASLEE